MAEPSWAEARKMEEDAREELAYQERQLGGHNSALRDVAKNAALAARHNSDVALVRKVTLKVFQHLQDTGLISFDASDFDPEAVLAEIEKEESNGS